MTLDSTFKTGSLRLFLGGNGYGIASSYWGSVGVGIVVVELGWGTVEIVVVAGVVIISSGLGVSSSTIGIGGTVHLGFVVSWGKSFRWVGAILLGLMGSRLMHHTMLAVFIGLIDLALHLNG